MKASVAIQVLPKSDNPSDVVPIVDKVIEYIQSTGLHYVVSPFETTIESDDYDKLMEIVKEAQLICIREGANSVSSYVKIFYAPDAGVLTIDEKISKYQ